MQHLHQTFIWEGAGFSKSIQVFCDNGNDGKRRGKLSIPGIFNTSSETKTGPTLKQSLPRKSNDAMIGKMITKVNSTEATIETKVDAGENAGSDTMVIRSSEQNEDSIQIEKEVIIQFIFSWLSDIKSTIFYDYRIWLI